CKATAFVSRDQRILNKAEELEVQYGLEVLHPERLWQVGPAPEFRFAESGGQGAGFMEVCSVNRRVNECNELLRDCGVDPVDIATKWSALGGEAAAKCVVLDGKIAGLSLASPFCKKNDAISVRV